MSNDVTSIIRVGVKRTSTGVFVLSDYLLAAYEESVRYVPTIQSTSTSPPYLVTSITLLPDLSSN